MFFTLRHSFERLEQLFAFHFNVMHMPHLSFLQCKISVPCGLPLQTKHSTGRHGYLITFESRDKTRLDRRTLFLLMLIPWVSKTCKVNEKIMFIRELGGRRQKVLEQLSRFWSLRFYPLPSCCLSGPHKNTKKHLSIKKTGSKLIWYFNVYSTLLLHMPFFILSSRAAGNSTTVLPNRLLTYLLTSPLMFCFLENLIVIISN